MFIQVKNLPNFIALFGAHVEVPNWGSNFKFVIIIWWGSAMIGPQIRIYADSVKKFNPSNPQKRDRVLNKFRSQIHKIAGTKRQELPGSCW